METTFPMHCYGKNYFQYMFIRKIVFNAFLKQKVFSMNFHAKIFFDEFFVKLFLVYF